MTSTPTLYWPAAQEEEAMKVKVGNTIHDGNDEMVMVILSEKDKENIANMPEDNTKYCCAPDGTDPDEIRAWMADE